ncbi:MAG: hypothetical protein H6732_05445 [Alphaproteobacteria bacterium]|nr:hypothetical protein [Alphaproteobacteria bacterium]
MRAPSQILLPVLLVACAKAGEPTKDEPQPRITERELPEEGLIVQEIDLDGDGTPEIWNLFQEREDAPRLRVRKKVDLNFDGRVDVVSHFDETGSLYLEELDADLDGVLDWTDHYKDGVRVLAEVDTNFDGRPDVFSYYAVGADGKSYIDRKERDTNGDGKIDAWERFDPSGAVVRTGRDTDGDGKMDVRDE